MPPAMPRSTEVRGCAGAGGTEMKDSAHERPHSGLVTDTGWVGFPSQLGARRELNEQCRGVSFQEPRGCGGHI